MAKGFRGQLEKIICSVYTYPMDYSVHDFDKNV